MVGTDGTRGCWRGWHGRAGVPVLAGDSCQQSPLVLLSTALAGGCDSQMCLCCSSSSWAPAGEREEQSGEGWQEAGAAIKPLL